MTQGKAVACLVGMVLAFAASMGISLLLDGHWSLAQAANCALYGLGGAALGYVWPEDGWRLGVWLGFCRLAFVPLNYLLAGDMMDWSGPGMVRQVMGVLEFTLPVFVACFGAAAGGIVKEHRSGKA